MTIAMQAYQRFGVSVASLHLDSSSFSVTGDYPSPEAKAEELATLKITYGYSKDHRPDLKQFLVDVICSNDANVRRPAVGHTGALNAEGGTPTRR